jgi:predicted  nucleic acid-binding Zn-ribbon protein
MEIAEQLTLLAELSSVEKKVTAAKARLEALPAEARKAQEEADKKKEAQTELERKQHELEMGRRKMDQEMHSEKDKLRKWENRADDIRGEREHAALRSEVGAQKRSISRLEGDILETMQELEDVEKNLLEAMQAAEDADKAAKAEFAKVEADVKVAQAEFDEVDGARQALVNKLPAPLVKRYDRIRERRGYAVSVIQGEMCGACRTTMPPQLVVQVYKGAVLETCAVCQRILVHEAMTRAPDAGEEAGDTADAAV